MPASVRCHPDFLALLYLASLCLFVLTWTLIIWSACAVMELTEDAVFDFDSMTMDDELDKLLKESLEEWDMEGEAQQDQQEQEATESESVASGPAHVPPECAALWTETSMPMVVGELFGDLLYHLVDIQGVLQCVFAWDLMPSQITEVTMHLQERRPRLMQRNKLFDCYKVEGGGFIRCVGLDHLQEMVSRVGHHFGMRELPGHVLERARLLESNLRTFLQPVTAVRQTPGELRYRRTQRYLHGDNAEALRESKRRRDTRYRQRRKARE